MKKVQVRYEGWGENWLLGTLADDGHHLLFEYSPQALAEGLDLVALRPRPMALSHAMLNGFGFGGVNATLVLRRWPVAA